MPFCEDASSDMKAANPALTYYHTHRHATIDVIMIIVLTAMVIIVMTTMLIIWMSMMLVMMMMPRW